MRFIFYSFIFLFSCKSILAQGLFDGFSKGKGNGDVALSAGIQLSEIYVAGTTELIYGRDNLVGGIFAIGGISDRWDVLVSLPYVHNTVQDISFGTKYRFIAKKRNKSTISAFGALHFSTPLVNYPTEIKFAAGQKATQIAPRMIVQYDNENGFFLQGQTSYSYAFDPVPSFYQFSFKGGWHGNHLYTDVWYDQQIGEGNVDFLGKVPYDSFRELTYSYSRIGGTIYYGISKWGFFANGSLVLKARNGWLFTTLGVGVVRKFSVKKD